MDCLARLIEGERAASNRAMQEKTTAGEQLEALIKAIADGRGVNSDFDAMGKAEADLALLLDKQSAMDELTNRLSKARKAQGIIADEALMSKNIADIQEQQKSLDDANEALKNAEKVLPTAKARQEAAESQAKEADDMMASAQQLKGCIPVLKNMEKQQKALNRQKHFMAELKKASDQADQAYAAAKEGYYRSQAGLLAVELEDGKPCPVCGALSHPHPAQLTNEAVTKEEMEEADRRHREAADALHEVDNAVTTLQTQVEKDNDRLREMHIQTGETEQHLEQRIGDLESHAKQLRNAIDDSRKACANLTTQIEKSRTTVEEGQKRFTALLKTAEKLEKRFRDHLAVAGFEDERAYRLAKMSESDINDIESQLKQYGEQKTSLTDQIAGLREKLAGKEKVDLSGLEQKQRDWKAEKEIAEAKEAELTKKLALHEDALKDIREARRQQKRKEEYWAVVRDLYNCCAGIAGGNRRAKMTFEAYVQQYYFKQVVAAANKRLTVLTDGVFTLRCKEEARDRVHQSGLDLDVLDRGTGQWRDVSTLSGGESFLASLALALGLSDVVQAQSGAIRMEAMFIDEGFGTLDDNALRNSLQVLADLADGKRLIGIISHVRDLEERIEKQIVVSKTLKGSKIDILA